jgi:tRNA dimethylallyltransferase
MSPWIVIVGATGSGKSRLAIDLALVLDAEVVSCDSKQVYRGGDIGSAKVTVTEARGVRHHLMDVCAPHEAFTALDFQRLARDTVRSGVFDGWPAEQG